jgi:hypothetical protein
MALTWSLDFHFTCETVKSLRIDIKKATLALTTVGLAETLAETEVFKSLKRRSSDGAR